VRKLIIAIDGPVGSGKSTVARRVAELLGYLYLDSGAMYRALGLAALRRGAELDDAEALERIASEAKIELRAGSASAKEERAQHAVPLQPPNEERAQSRGIGTPLQTKNDGRGGEAIRVLLDGEDVTEAIRAPEVSQAASRVAVFAGVRRHLVAQQQRAGRGGGVVMEGRDIGTVVFPNADLKIYLDASIEVRAQRRWREHHARGEKLDLPRMVEEVRERDRRDRERDVSPLVRAPDALYVDTTAMEVEETAGLIASLARDREKAVASG